MRRLFSLFFCLLAVSALAEPTEDPATLVKTGQTAPQFKVATLDGQIFDLKKARGKVVLVNFFATECPPCMAEMPQLQDRIWKRFQGPHFALVAIDRDEPPEMVAAWEKKHPFPFPIACDPQRRVYAKFARQDIPRNFLLDTNGTVVFESIGYGPVEFDQLLAAIQKATANSQ